MKSHPFIIATVFSVLASSIALAPAPVKSGPVKPLPQVVDGYAIVGAGGLMNALAVVGENKKACQIYFNRNLLYPNRIVSPIPCDAYTHGKILAKDIDTYALYGSSVIVKEAIAQGYEYGYSDYLKSLACVSWSHYQYLSANYTRKYKTAISLIWTVNRADLDKLCKTL